MNIEICANCETENVPGEKRTDGPINVEETDEFCEFCMHSSGANRVRFYYKIASDIDKTEAQITATLARIHWAAIKKQEK